MVISKAKHLAGLKEIHGLIIYTKRPWLGIAKVANFSARFLSPNLSSAPFIYWSWPETSIDGRRFLNFLTVSQAACQLVVKYLGGPCSSRFWIKTL